MGIWIRSQDKTHLINTKHVGIVQFDENDFSIIAHDAMKDGSVPDILGDYDTEERVIEVLDMLQKEIIQGTDGYAFQMPEK